jgi:hypothetical protein
MPFIVFLIGLQGVLAIVVGIRPMIPLIMAGAFGYMLVVPLLSGTQQTLWQTRVPHHMQGRIAAVRATIGNAAVPLALAIAGPMADRIFNPLLAAGGALDGTFVATILGVGSHRGIGLLFVAMGLLSIAGAALAYLHPRIRHLEQELPSFVEQAPQPAQAAPEAPGRPEQSSPTTLAAS